MNDLLALCTNPACGLAYPFINLVQGGGMATINMEGSRTNCPRCNNDARIGDGTYSYKNEA